MEHTDNVFNAKTKYKQDKLSSLFPPMQDTEFTSLVESIKNNGQQEAILVKGDSIVDGWHRYCACVYLKATPWMWEYDPEHDGEDMTTLVLSKNFDRRHLSAVDRVRIAAEALGYNPDGRDRKKISMQEVAKRLGVSTKTVQRAKQDTMSSSLAKEKAAPTLEGLQKREKMLLGQLDSVRKQIAAFSPPRRIRK